MSTADFDAFVKRQQAEKRQMAAFDPQQQLNEWLEHLEALYRQIENYLHTYIQAGTASVAYRSIQLNEEFIGTYLAQELVLTIGPSTVTFTPIGTMLIGTRGRVDVQGPLGSARLALVNKEVTNAHQLVHVTVRRVGDPPPAPPTAQDVKQITLVWKISTPPPEMKFLELTQEAFFNMILAVANG